MNYLERAYYEPRMSFRALVRVDDVDAFAFAGRDAK